MTLLDDILDTGMLATVLLTVIWIIYMVRKEMKKDVNQN